VDLAKLGLKALLHKFLSVHLLWVFFLLAYVLCDALLDIMNNRCVLNLSFKKRITLTRLRALFFMYIDAICVIFLLRKVRVVSSSIITWSMFGSMNVRSFSLDKASGLWIKRVACLIGSVDLLVSNLTLLVVRDRVL